MISPINIIGITGGIASGKTVATDALRAAGYTIVDADDISRALTAAGSPGESALVSLFHEAAEGGRLDRRKLRRMISDDVAAREKLNAYIHPQIVHAVKSELAKTRRAILSAPLLFETGLDALCDVVICVTAPVEARIRRITARDGVSEDDARAMIAAQTPNAYTVSRADHVVSSDVPLPDFTRKITELVSSLMPAE